MGFASRLGGIFATGLFLSAIVSTGMAKYSGGTGEPNDPYQIANAADLIALGETPDDYDKHFILTADIDLSGYDGKDGRPAFEVIGDCYTSSNGITTYVKGTPFAGMFDGNGKAILHLTSLKANGDLLGLFGGLARGAEVKNLRVFADINIDATDGAVGALAGYNGGTVTQCSSEGVVTGEGWMSVGGMVGLNMGGTITDCHSTAVVSGGRGVGGLVGWNSHWQGDGLRLRGRVAQCYSAGKVGGVLDVGGLVGHNGGEVVGCFWDIETSGTSESEGGTGETTAKMRTAATFLEVGWDFVDETANGIEDIWWIDEGQDYPRLWWEPRPVVRLPVIELDATTFDAGIAEGVVLVDFFATWCSPCRTQAPILEEVADRLEGRAQVAKLDIDKARSILQRYGVTAVPTLILFRNGVEVKRFVGVTSADVLVAAILEAVELEQ